MSTDKEGENRPAGPGVRDEATDAAAAHLIVQLSMPPEIPARLPGVGEVVVCTRLLDLAASRAWFEEGRAGCEVVTISCAGRSGVLCVEHGLAVSVVNAVLGLAVPPLAGPLSCIERGVLAGTLATMFTELGLTPRIRLGEDLGAGAKEGASVVALTVKLPGRKGRAWLAGSDDFHAGIWASREPGRGVFTPWLEVAATTLEEAELVGAEPGDRVVFDETAALAPDEDWPVRVCRDGGSFPAWWLADGTVVAVDWPAGEAVTRPGRPASIHRTGGDATVSPGAVPVVAGCACPAIDPARAVRLVIPRRGPLLVEAGNRGWAYAEITALDGALALTITRTLAGSRTGFRTTPP